MYPREKPGKDELKKWLATWKDDLGMAGYGPLTRGETPYELAKLRPIGLETAAAGDSDATKAAIDAENRRTQRENAKNKLEYDARMREIQNRLASKLMKALRKTAPIKLKSVTAKCGHVDAGVMSTESFDGVAMWKMLEADEKADVSDYHAKQYQLQYEQLRDHPLKNNCSPQDFSERMDLFAESINPYLDVPFEGARFGKFVLAQLPECLGADVRSLKRELEGVSKYKLDDADYVVGKALALVQDAHKPSTKSIPAVVQLAINGKAAAGVNSADAAAAARLKKMEAGIERLLQREAAAMVANPQGGPKGGFHPNDKKGEPKGGAGGGNRLPEGQLCSKGTCNFAHDRLKPDAPCFRDPSWPGPLPHRT